MSCQYIIKMNYNDNQQNSQHLLIWVNQERLFIEEHSKIYSIDQLKESKLLPLLLDKIHPSFFSSLIDKPYEHISYLTHIEKYLNEIEDLKIRRPFRQVLVDRDCISDIVKLTLFIIMRHQIKQEFVDRILELEQQVQIYLMNELKLIQENTQNNMEIKQIFEKVEELEDENDLFHQKIREIEQKNEELRVMQSQMKEENEKLFEQNRLNMLQKAGVMEMLGVHQLKDYICIFRDLEQERIALIHTQKEIQADNGKLSEENQEMSEKIIQDKLIVDHLDQEINHYKAILQDFEAESKKSLLTVSKENKENIKGDYLTSSIIPVRMTKSIEPDGIHDTTICSLKYIRTIEDEEDPLTVSIKDHNESLTQKLQKVYGTIQTLNSEIARLKEERLALLRNNRKKEKRIAMAEREFMEFRLNYQFTISG